MINRFLKRRDILFRVPAFDFSTGLQIYLNGDDNLLDQSGNGRNGTQGNASPVTYEAGNINNAIKINPAFVNVENWNFAVSANGVDIPFAVSIQVNVTTLSTTQMFFGAMAGGHEYHGFVHTDGVLYFRVFDVENYLEIATPIASMSINQNVGLIFSYDGSGLASGLNIKVNNIQPVITETTSGTFNYISDKATRINIGAYHQAEQYKLQGTIEEFYFWLDRTMTSEELTEINARRLAAQTLI